MATESPLVPEGTRTGKGAGITDDPLIVFNFGLEVDGVLEGYFSDCSGIGSEHDIVESQLVNKNGKSFVFKAPGIIKYNDVSLKRGITADTAIRLGRYFGNSPQFWLNLQGQYDIAVIEQDRGPAIAREVRPPPRAA